jgi:hypothetical protein
LIAYGWVPDSPEKWGLRSVPGCDGEFLVPLYREVAPVIALQLPDGFHGIIALEFLPTDLLALEAGQRLFKLPVSQGGYAAIEGVPILRRVGSLEITAVLPDGTVADPKQLSREPVQFRWVYSFADPPTTGPYRYHFFIVGTFEQSERAKRLLFDIEGEGTTNLFKENPQKCHRMVNILRSARSPVSVEDAQRLLKAGSAAVR